MYYTVLSNIGHGGIVDIGGGFSENRDDKFVKDGGTTAMRRMCRIFGFPPSITLVL